MFALHPPHFHSPSGSVVTEEDNKDAAGGEREARLFADLLLSQPQLLRSPWLQAFVIAKVTPAERMANEKAVSRLPETMHRWPIMVLVVRRNVYNLSVVYYSRRGDGAGWGSGGRRRRNKNRRRMREKEMNRRRSRRRSRRSR